MSVGFYITFIGLLTRRYIEQTPTGAAGLARRGLSGKDKTA
jgi:hypothetical protein